MDRFSRTLADGTIECFDGTNSASFPPGPTQASDVAAFFAPTDASHANWLKDSQIDAADLVNLRLAFRHENLIRKLVRALRATSAGANTAATNAGLPASADVPDVTQPQFKAAIRNWL